MGMVHYGDASMVCSCVGDLLTAGWFWRFGMFVYIEATRT